MPTSTLTRLRLLSTGLNNYLAGNAIGSKGVQFLIKADMPLLYELGLGKVGVIVDYCMLGNEEFKYLTKGNWPQLEIINIGNPKSNSRQQQHTIQRSLLNCT